MHSETSVLIHFIYFFTLSVFFLHKKAICAVHSLLCSHDADPRYTDPQVRAHVAKLYLPLIPIVMETLQQLHDFSGQQMQPINIVIVIPLLHTFILFAECLCFQHSCTWECFSYFSVDSSPARVRHASAHADDADPDSGSTISQSVAMAIAGSPLPHAKANSFVLPTVVSDRGRGHAVPPGPTYWQVTDLPLCGRLLPQFDRRSLCPFSPHKHISMLLFFCEVQLLLLACRWLSVLFYYNCL